MHHLINRRVFCGASAAFFASRASAQITSLGDAINKAGRQRMLSQRMGKAWLGLGQGIEVASAQRVLDQSVSLFESQLIELKAFAPPGETRDTYLQLESAWAGYRSLLRTHTPTQPQGKTLLEQSGRVLALAHKGTGEFERQSGKPGARLVNMAGRQRMLSQRMAQFYLADRWGLDSASSQAEIAKARAEFVAALEVLRNAPEATADVRQQLSLADGQWLFFDAALRTHAADARRASDVFVSSENLLQVMDRVTALYARILG